MAGLVAMLVLTSAGCGSSDADDSAGDTAPKETSLSKREFISAADKVCRRLGRDTKDSEERVQKLQVSYPEAADEEALDQRVREVARLLGRFEKLFRASNEELAGLRRPDDSALTKYLERRDAYADGVARLAAAQADFADAPANDQARANKAIGSASNAGDRTEARLQRLARAYGFKTCHRGA